MGTTLFRMGLDRENETDLRCPLWNCFYRCKLAYKSQLPLRHHISKNWLFKASRTKDIRVWVRCTEPSRTCATHSLQNPPITKSQCVVEHTHTKMAADLRHCSAELFRIDSTMSGYIETRADIKSTCSNLLCLFREGQGPQRQVHIKSITLAE